MYKCDPYYDCNETRTHSPSSIATKQELIQLQKDLKTLGYYEGTIDGVPGKMTKEAIESFQRENGLEITGTADVQTIQAVRNATD